MDKILMRFLKQILIVIIFLTVNFGCQIQEDKSNLVEAQFNIDSSLLVKSPITDTSLNFSINIPKNWSKLDSGLESHLKSNLLKNEYQEAQLKFGFTNQEDNSLMLLLDITNIHDSIFSELKTSYKQILNKEKQWDEVLFQEFSYNSFRFQQYVLQNDNMLNFKLICSEQNLEPDNQIKFELLFFLNRNNLNLNIKTVESCIGSIKSLTL